MSFAIFTDETGHEKIDRQHATLVGPEKQT